jgi:hypothetical protein
VVEFDHNKAVSASARDALRPLGLRQKGRSRVWIDDRRWWLILVEFQASGWSKGSYLNVAPMWMWNPTARRSLHPDFMGRVADFAAADDLARFAVAMADCAVTAAEEVKRWRALILDDTGRAADAIASAPRKAPASYPDLNGGIASGLAGRWPDAERLLAAFCERAETFASPDTLRVEAARRLLQVVGTTRFAELTDEWIKSQRDAAGLPALAAPD